MQSFCGINLNVLLQQIVVSNRSENPLFIEEIMKNKVIECMQNSVELKNQVHALRNVEYSVNKSNKIVLYVQFNYDFHSDLTSLIVKMKKNFE
jgi:hypothetical protein